MLAEDDRRRATSSCASGLRMRPSRPHIAAATLMSTTPGTLFRRRTIAVSVTLRAALTSRRGRRDACRDGATPLRRSRYARSGDVHVAYQVVGDGPVDIVFVGGLRSRIATSSGRRPCTAASVERLGSFARLVLFDKRGMGLSDRVRGRDTRGAHGRRARGDGSRRLGTGGADRRVRGWTAVHAVRRHAIPERTVALAARVEPRSRRT